MFTLIRMNPDSVGFRLTKEEARKIATQLLIAAEVSDEIFYKNHARPTEFGCSIYSI